MGFFDKLKNGLTKTRESIAKQVNNVFSVFVKVDDELFENLEEALIMADIGVETSTYIIEKLRDNVKHKHITDGIHGRRKGTVLPRPLHASCYEAYNGDTSHRIRGAIGDCKKHPRTHINTNNTDLSGYIPADS